MLHILHLNKTLRYMKHALSEPIKSGRLISPIRNQLRYSYCLLCIYIYPQVHIHCSSFQILPWLLLWSCLLLLHSYWTTAVLVIKRTQLLPCSIIYIPPFRIGTYGNHQICGHHNKISKNGSRTLIIHLTSSDLALSTNSY